MGITLAGAVMAAAVPFVSTTMRLMTKQDLRLEVRQGLRATLDTLVRDIRLAGGCLPTNGSYIALAGTNAGVQDQLTLRGGLADPDLGCISTALRVELATDASTLSVDAADGFAAGQIAYLRHLDGAGEFFVVATVDTATDTLTRDGAASRDFPVGSGVFGVDERVYAIDATAASAPRLTIDANRAGPTPFAVGITELDVRYVLDRDCPSCDVVDLPSGNAEWWLVQGISVTVTAIAVNPPRPTDAYTVTRTVKAHPRNLLLGG